jgi:putative CocE/NonD family hydrolase
MTGFSFTGTSQIATAAYAGPALKAIMPFNVFPDLYRDLVYPGGMYNSWISAWVGAGRQFAVGLASVQDGATQPACDANMAQQAGPNEAQTADTAAHPYLDGYWANDPATLTARVHVPILGCVDWQDTTVYSRSFNEFRDDFNPYTTWLVGGDGAHTACGITRALEVKFLDHYLKQADNGWQTDPHLLLIHEAGGVPQPDQAQDTMGRWQSSFASWSDVTAAIKPVPLYLHSGGLLDLEPPAHPEAADSYNYGDPTANTPPDFGGNSSWNRPAVPGGEVTYTTPRLAHDVEFLGSGSANLWVSSTAPDTDVQIMLSEIRPDGQEQFVENGWLRLVDRKLDPRGSTVLRPLPTYLSSDVEPLTPTVPVLARIELEPFDHVFRAGSAIRLSIDTPGGWLASAPGPAVDAVEHTPGMASALMLGDLPGAGAHAPLPACSALLNQPCRAAGGTVPGGSLSFP